MVRGWEVGRPALALWSVALFLTGAVATMVSATVAPIGSDDVQLMVRAALFGAAWVALAAGPLHWGTIIASLGAGLLVGGFRIASADATKGGLWPLAVVVWAAGSVGGAILATAVLLAWRAVRARTSLELLRTPAATTLVFVFVGVPLFIVAFVPYGERDATDVSLQSVTLRCDQGPLPVLQVRGSFRHLPLRHTSVVKIEALPVAQEPRAVGIAVTERMGWLQGPIGDDTFDLEVPVADPAHLPSQFVRSYSIPGGRAIESPLRPVLRLGCSGA